jgi:menaquinone-dependent protoporphyrinogen oxidase
VAVFGMGPRDDTEDAWGRSRAQVDRALAKRAWLAPVAVTVFGGADPPGRGKRPQRGLWNWQVMRTWAADTLATAARAGQTAASQ